MDISLWNEAIGLAACVVAAAVAWTLGALVSDFIIDPVARKYRAIKRGSNDE